MTGRNKTTSYITDGKFYDHFPKLGGGAEKIVSAFMDGNTYVIATEDHIYRTREDGEIERLRFKILEEETK